MKLPNPSNVLLIGAAAATTASLASASNTILDDPTRNYLGQKTYGTDASFPQHHSTTSTANNSPFGTSRQEFYNRYMDGCRAIDATLCDDTEHDRIEMNIRQPGSMMNYTDMGFRLVKAPPTLFKSLVKFWKDNKGKEQPEEWFAGNTYTNHWEAPTTMLSVDDTKLKGAGDELKQQIWDAARSFLEEWTGQQLTPTSLYGIRTYTENAVLATHVDRMPLVTSAIINVAQDVDEPWPLELFAHDGKAYNVTMEVREMLCMLWCIQLIVAAHFDDNLYLSLYSLAFLLQPGDMILYER